MVSRAGVSVDEVRIRDSKNPLSPEISISYDAFEMLKSAPAEGIFSSDDTEIHVHFLEDKSVALRQPSSGIDLLFNSEEWATFVGGCESGFFDKVNYGVAA